MHTPPNPGSPEAVEQGCICPIAVNHYGKGVPTTHGSQQDEARSFWKSNECPLHGKDLDL